MTDAKPKIPTLSAVESSNISHVGYEPADKEMFIRFKSGGLYRYADVPADAHRAFMEAESKGKHFSQSFAGRFKHTKLDA